MDIANLLAFLPTIIRYAGTVKEILDLANSNSDIANKLRTQAGPVISFLEQYGAQLFPQAAKPIQVVGAAIAAYDPNITKWVQGAVNIIVKPTPLLDVDGIYGPLTRAGVTKLQEQLGLKPDGLAGRITQAAIDSYFAKQSAAS